MRIESVYVRNFRNLKDQSICFENGLNEIVGNNAQGKTSVLEAVHVLILGNSFRTYQIRDIVKHDQPGFFVEATVDLSGVRKTVSLSFDGVKRSVAIDGQTQPSSSDLLGTILGVTTTLDDHTLVFGPPSVRRRFLDEQIAQIDPFYVAQLRRYGKALSHRNRLLKIREFRSIAAWEEQLARAAAYIVAERRKTVDLLTPKVLSAYESLFQNATVSFGMKYLTQAPPCESIEWYIRQYRERRDQEVRAAATLIGPHRDDIEWSIGGRSCRSVASLGQARSVALSVRCAEWELLRERSSETPLFLIDDVQSMLDPQRTALLFDLCTRLGQVYMTSHCQQSPLSSVISVSDGNTVSSS